MWEGVVWHTQGLVVYSDSCGWAEILRANQIDGLDSGFDFCQKVQCSEMGGDDNVMGLFFVSKLVLARRL